MANLDTQRTTGQHIAASKVNGTTVYDATGKKIGSVYDVMLDKISGRADYAILSFGGFFGVGSRYYPLPWHQLEYDVGLEGYIVSVGRNQLEAGPSYEEGQLPQWDDIRSHDIDTYYGRAAVSGEKLLEEEELGPVVPPGLANPMSR